jgi:hypothetical protein
VIDWLAAFAFTQAVEAPIYRRGARASWLEALGASALTHPIVWFVVPAVVAAVCAPMGLGVVDQWFVMLVAAETFAVAAEAAYMRWLGRRRPLLWSIVANVASVTLGLWVREVTGWV